MLSGSWAWRLILATFLLLSSQALRSPLATLSAKLGTSNHFSRGFGHVFAHNFFLRPPTAILSREVRLGGNLKTLIGKKRTWPLLESAKMFATLAAPLEKLLADSWDFLPVRRGSPSRALLLLGAVGSLFPRPQPAIDPHSSSKVPVRASRERPLPKFPPGLGTKRQKGSKKISKLCTHLRCSALLITRDMLSAN